MEQLRAILEIERLHERFNHEIACVPLRECGQRFHVCGQWHELSDEPSRPAGCGPGRPLGSALIVAAPACQMSGYLLWPSAEG
jgi:hypothetical protein